MDMTTTQELKEVKIALSCKDFVDGMKNINYVLDYEDGEKYVFTDSEIGFTIIYFPEHKGFDVLQSRRDIPWELRTINK